MTTAYTSLLGLALPVTGELSGTWGDTVNNSITSLLDSAIAGTTTISSDADVTLSTTTGAANTSREAILLWTAGGTVTRNITAPAQSKTYIVINASSSTQSIVLRGVGPTTGVTIIKGESAVCAWNGTDFIKVSNISGAGVFSSLTVTGTTTLSGLTASTALALDASKNVVSVANTGTGSNVLATSPTLVTPALGTPSSATLTNATGLPISTGVSGLGTGVATFLATPSSANLASAVTDETGSGSLVFATSPTLVTPALGTPSSGVVTNLTGTASININGTVGATTASTGSFTSLAYSTTLTGGTGIVNLGSGQFYKDASGNVGIGTTSPGANLEVKGASGQNIYVSYTSGSQLRLKSDSGDSGVGTTGATPLLFLTSNAEKMRIDSSGNVGIGTSSPSCPLNVVSASSALAIAINGRSSDNLGAMYFYANNGSTQYATLTASATEFRFSSVPAAAVQTFYTNGTEQMRITAAGNVGIGTSSPSVKFQVNHSSDVAAINASGGGVTLGMSNSSANDVLLRMTNNSSNFWDIRNLTSGSALTFGYNGDERMRIDSSGNVLVGQTSQTSTEKFGVTQSATGSSAVRFYASSASYTNDIVQISCVRSGATTEYNAFTVFDNNTTLKMLIRPNGNLLNANNSYGSLSDISLKENIVDATPKLDGLMQVRVRNYNLKDDVNKIKQIGVVAQELETVFPGMIETDGEGIKAVKYSVFVPMMLKAIQEQQALITSLTARIAALEIK